LEFEPFGWVHGIRDFAWVLSLGGTLNLERRNRVGVRTKFLDKWRFGRAGGNAEMLKS
jgi:hypothetical protein